jgi:hypothetical protein
LNPKVTVSEASHLPPLFTLGSRFEKNKNPGSLIERNRFLLAAPDIGVHVHELEAGKSEQIPRRPFAEENLTNGKEVL